MYGIIYVNIWGILMGSMLPYMAYMDPMGNAPVKWMNMMKRANSCHFFSVGT